MQKCRAPNGKSRAADGVFGEGELRNRSRAWLLQKEAKGNGMNKREEGKVWWEIRGKERKIGMGGVTERSKAKERNLKKENSTKEEG